MYVRVCLNECCTSAGACRSQKRPSDPLELELQVVVSCPPGCWEPSLGLLEEWQVLLIAELSACGILLK